MTRCAAMPTVRCRRLTIITGTTADRRAHAIKPVYQKGRDSQIFQALDPQSTILRHSATVTVRANEELDAASCLAPVCAARQFEARRDSCVWSRRRRPRGVAGHDDHGRL